MFGPKQSQNFHTGVVGWKQQHINYLELKAILLVSSPSTEWKLTWTYYMKHSHCRPLRLKLICSHLTSIISLRNNFLFNLIHTYMPLMILASTGLISLLSLPPPLCFQDYCENCWVCSSTILLSNQGWLFYQHQDPTQKRPLTPEEKAEVTGMQSIRHWWETSEPSENTINTVSIHGTHPNNRCTLCL